MAKPNSTSTDVYVRLDSKVRAALRAQAEREHRTLSNLIGKILHEYVDTSAKPKPNGHHHPTSAAKSAAARPE
jgi:hypothetical protein